MLTIFFRCMIIFFLLLIVVRLMGKRQIGEMQPFELVITLIIADVATIPMADVSIPILYGVAGIITLFVLHQLLSLADRKSKRLSNVISGTPTVVINSKGINLKALQKQNLSVDDLFESLRCAGYASFDEIAFAIFETNGKLSVVPKSPEAKEKASLPLVLITLGKADDDKLKRLHIKKDWLKEVLQAQGVESIRDVQVLTVDNNGKMFLQLKNRGYVTFNTDYRGSTEVW